MPHQLKLISLGASPEARRCFTRRASPVRSSCFRGWHLASASAFGGLSFNYTHPELNLFFMVFLASNPKTINLLILSSTKRKSNSK
jgi:hypothetical protein